MIERDIYPWLNYLLVEATGRNNEWVISSCPLARWTHEHGTDVKPSFGVRVDEHEVSRVHCFSCNYSGTQTELLGRLREYVGDEDYGLDLDSAEAMVLSDMDTGGLRLEIGEITTKEDFAPKKLYEFAESYIDNFPKAYGGESGVHSYLRERRVSPSVAEKCDFRSDLYQNRIGVPVRDFNGVLRGFHGRTTIGEQPTYKMYTYRNHNNPVVWFGEHWVDPNRPVIIVESVFDLTSVKALYDNVICPLTASINVGKIKRIGDIPEMILMFDGDKAGREAQQKMMKVLGSQIVGVVNLPDGSDPNSLSTTDLNELISPWFNINLLKIAGG